MKKIIYLLILFLLSLNTFAQEAAKPAENKVAEATAQRGGGDIFFLDVLGIKGILIIIFILIFFYTYRNSVRIFQWIDNQTYGKRDYILKKLEIMHIEIDPTKITYILLFCSFGLPAKWLWWWGFFRAVGSCWGISATRAATACGQVFWNRSRKS